MQLDLQSPPGRDISAWADASSEEGENPEFQHPSPEFWPRAIEDPEPDLEPESWQLPETMPEEQEWVNSETVLQEHESADAATRDEILAVLRAFRVTSQKVLGVYNKSHQLLPLCTADVKAQLEDGVYPKRAGSSYTKGKGKGKGADVPPRKGNTSKTNKIHELRLADVLPPPPPNHLRSLSNTVNNTSSAPVNGQCKVFPLAVQVPIGTGVMGQPCYNP
eukprot:TRINITY_DN5350_c0_g1_i1.p1 TRINITY_DN5350_c0_g1~~TRINITY_DN5350_c0_g1_i1.p1  ORF type:complete len:220 (-),score=36.73 TRINITY_DN5350_c0_g1_i1:405-1064(-)